MTTTIRTGVKRPGGSRFKAPKISKVDHLCTVDGGIVRPICGATGGTEVASWTDELCARCAAKAS